MTVEEFLEALREAAPFFNWQIVNQRIRGELVDGGTPKNIGSAFGCCPIEAVYFNRRDTFTSFGTARRELGIPDGLFENITLAADFSLDDLGRLRATGVREDPREELRQGMLDALNLKEET